MIIFKSQATHISTREKVSTSKHYNLKCMPTVFHSRLFCIQQLEYTPNKRLTGISWLDLQNFIFLNV